LTRPFDKHLDSDELDKFLSLQRTSVSDSGRLSEESLREAERHVESCPDCSRKLQMHKSVHSEILRMRAPFPSPLTPDCIGDAEWLEVAAGQYPEAKTRELMKHAAQCGHCGLLLKNAAESLVDETTPSEEVWLASLRSAQPEWRRNIAATLRASAGAKDDTREKKDGVQWWQALFSLPRPALAFAGIAVAAMGGWLGWRALHPPLAEQLLAQAYTERRTLEVRIPGARYAPLRVERSSGGSNFDKPESLLKAESLIGESLRKSPDDPTWLQAKARADLLDGNYEPAIKALQQDLDLQPDSPSVMIDLASAYYGRASANADRQVDYAVAIDYLGRALAKTPNDSLALFNRAICEEKLYLYDPARTDWQKYLTIDPVGPWAEEARKNLTRVEQKIKNKHASVLRPLLSAPDLVSLPSREDWVTETDGRVEAYLHVAVTQWLPEAFPQSQTQASLQTQPAHQALEVLAQVIRERHGDVWLADVLQGPHGTNFAMGSSLLAAALQADDRGDYLEANHDAQEAARLLGAARNFAAEVRAQVEELYSDHLLYDGGKCVALGNSLSLGLRQHRYQWIQAQTSLERSMCAGLVGDQGTVRSATDRGTIEAGDHRYAALFVRGLGFQADEATDIGDTQRGTALASKGLEKFWNSDVDLIKGYNLYTDLDTVGDTLHLPNLQVTVWQQATALIDLHSDLVQRAMAHRFFADAAYLANMPALASLELSKARDLFAAAPPTEATARGKLDADIFQAGLEVRQGELDRADQHLRTAQAELEGHLIYGQEMTLCAAKAELRMRRHDSAAAESDLRAAIFLAEWGLQTFNSQSARRRWAQQTAGTYRNLVAWKLLDGDAAGALEFWEWYKGAEFRVGNTRASDAFQDMDTASPPDLRTAPPLPSPTVVAQQLPLLTQETTITLVALPEGAAVWAYDDRGVSGHWLTKSVREIKDRVAGLRELCSSRETSVAVLRSASRALYDILIAPIEDRITPGRTLVFEADGFLSDVPFEALVDRQGHYLVERATIVTSPGLYQLLRLSPALPINAETPVLVVSVSAPSVGGVDPVAAADREAHFVASRFRGAQSLEGPAATLAAIRRTLPSVRVFHFAGHAISLPDRNGLLLAERDNGSQQARVVGADSLDPAIVRNLQLAVLSACATGARSGTESSGTEGLSEAFLRSGVRNVVASRWNVDSEATAAFMEKFYANLLAGSEVSASVRAAQLQLASEPEFAHPYYWAAFRAQGL
jgi:CHAT domain-containing protein/tetratricopeptide (TPR) repeat protein